METYEAGDKVKLRATDSIPEGTSRNEILTIACAHPDEDRYFFFIRGDRRGSGGSTCENHETHWVATSNILVKISGPELKIRKTNSKELIINNHD